MQGNAHTNGYTIQEDIPSHDLPPEIYYSHYIRIDELNHVIDFWSTGTHQGKEPDGGEWILLTDRGGYQFRALPDAAENVISSDGIPLYDYVGDEVRERSPEDIEADRVAQEAQPTLPNYQEFLQGLWEVFSDE